MTLIANGPGVSLGTFARRFHWLDRTLCDRQVK